VTYNSIRCEAVDVKTDTGVCPGVARTELGEMFVIGARTPESKGICCQAFAAMSPMKLVMATAEGMEWEKTGHFDVTCPHGAVTFRLSRSV
jgi:uncharacterized repeat protein (TIGR04076 family)